MQKSAVATYAAEPSWVGTAQGVAESRVMAELRTKGGVWFLAETAFQSNKHLPAKLVALAL